MPQRERYLFVCTNRLADSDAKASCAASCLDQCSSGVCVLVEPDHFFYGRVTVADVPEIVEAIASGQRVERLALSADDLAKG